VSVRQGTGPNVPLNDLKRLHSRFGADLIPAVEATIRSGWWLSGARVSAFAEAFAGYHRVPYCVPVANGTDALELAMRAVLAERRCSGRDVITVANAGGYTVTACRQIGLMPVFVDIEDASQLIDLESGVAALSKDTAMVVVTHLYGGVVDVPALRAAMKAAGYADVPIIEDCSQAHGADCNGQMVGAMGDVGTFSFYPTKNLGAMGDAGAVVTADPKLHAALRQLHQYGWSEKYRVALPGGRNSRMDEIQAAVLSTLLPHLADFNRRRREILAAYREAGGERACFISSPNGTVAHLAVALCSRRADFRRFMGERGIATEIHYPVLDCDQAGWQGQPFRIGPSGLAASRRSVERVVTLPCFPLMTDGEINQVADALRGWNAS
jgi:aminotransferase EvaB